MIKAFHRPTTVDEAVRLAQELGDKAAFLAGGTELNSTERPTAAEAMISLDRLALDSVRVEDSTLIVGASVTLQILLDHPDTPAVLRQALATISSRNIRNAATIGGQLATRQPFGDAAPALLALDTQLDVFDAAGPRRIAAAAFPDQRRALIVALRIPLQGRFAGTRSFARAASDRSVVVAAVGHSRVDGALQAPVVAVGGVAPALSRLGDVERWLEGQREVDREELEARVIAAVSPSGDFRASSAVRRQVAGVLVGRAFDAAREQEVPR